jgi:ZIP family zinc transporter
MTDVQLAFLLTILAGLSTGIGSLIAFVVKEKSTRMLTFSMGFAAGVMLYVSFMEILPEAIHALSEYLGCEEEGTWAGIAAFFGGMLLVGLIDKLIPSKDNPHELIDTHDVPPKKQKDLMRVGILTAVALAIHNFPEGVATFVATLESPQLGMTIAAAIALHNIPEGIAVSMPIYHATGDRKKAFFYSFLSGIVEPLGAFIGYLVLMPYLTPMVMGLLLAGVAGIMVFISIDQLLPASQEYGEHHVSIYGFVIGMAVMALSLAMMAGHHAH